MSEFWNIQIFIKELLDSLGFFKKKFSKSFISYILAFDNYFPVIIHIYQVKCGKRLLPVPE